MRAQPRHSMSMIVYVSPIMLAAIRRWASKRRSAAGLVLVTPVRRAPVPAAKCLKCTACPRERADSGGHEHQPGQKRPALGR